VADIHVAGVSGDPCGAVRWTPELIVGTLNSVFFKFLNFLKFLNIQ